MGAADKPNETSAQRYEQTFWLSAPLEQLGSSLFLLALSGYLALPSHGTLYYVSLTLDLTGVLIHYRSSAVLVQHSCHVPGAFL